MSDETLRGRRMVFVVCSAVVSVLVLVQAALAGQFLFSGGEIAVHGYVGNATFMVALGALAAVLWSRAPGWLAALTLALVMVLFAQTGLGYLGRDTTEAAAWHIPLGVLSFGIATATTAAALVDFRSVDAGVTARQ